MPLTMKNQEVEELSEIAEWPVVKSLQDVMKEGTSATKVAQ